MAGSAWQLRFLWNDYPWLAAATAQGDSLIANGSVTGSPVRVHRDKTYSSGNQPLQLTGRYIEQDSNFPFQTLSLGIQQVFINHTACTEVAAAPDADSQTAAEAVLAVLGADSCYLPLIESRVLALNASSIEEAQEILSPLCSQQFCCSPVRGPAPQPGPQPRPGFSFLPGPAHPPQTSHTAAEDVLPQVKFRDQISMLQLCCTPDCSTSDTANDLFEDRSVQADTFIAAGVPQGIAPPPVPHIAALTPAPASAPIHKLQNASHLPPAADPSPPVPAPDRSRAAQHPSPAMLPQTPGPGPSQVPNSMQAPQAPAPSPQEGAHLHVAAPSSGPAPSPSRAPSPEISHLMPASQHGLSTPAVAGVTVGAACLCLGSAALAALFWRARQAAQGAEVIPVPALAAAETKPAQPPLGRSLASIHVHSPFEEDELQQMGQQCAALQGDQLTLRPQVWCWPIIGWCPW